MDRKTVFVIGAGASKEANLPTGLELKNKIVQLLNIRFPDGYNQTSGDLTITEVFRLLVKGEDGQMGDINSYIHEAWHIRDAMPQAISIDNFIDTHRENQKIALCGKLAVVQSILGAEKKSLLYFDKYKNASTLNFNSLEKTWYSSFFQLLTENCAKSELKARFQNITLIIFNYDRCIEHFLLHALQNYYKINEAEAAEIVKHLNIYHPYGHVGNLPWMQAKDSMAFGELPNAQKLVILANQIKTFAEGTDPDASEIAKIKEHMAKVSHLIFLGFAFHKLNMKLLIPTANLTGFNVVRCFATAYLLSDSNKEAISEKIKGLYSSEVGIKMADLQCNTFFNEYKNSLEF